MDEQHRLTHLRARAGAVRDQGRKLMARAKAMAPGAMREMLEAQATILIDAAWDLEAQALELAPPLGSA
jgi:hypothetical protein